MPDALKRFQVRIGVQADGAFGPRTLIAAAVFFRLSAAEAAHFFAQCCHESGGFQRFEENLTYTRPARIVAIWPRRFPDQESAAPFVRNPEALANAVYAHRMGNGGPESGDGWRFRGRGALQLTGRENYTAFANSAPSLSGVLQNPDLVAGPLAFDSAAWFFTTNRLWQIASQGVGDDVVLELTRRINGGTHGLADRRDLTNQFHGWLT